VKEKRLDLSAIKIAAKIIIQGGIVVYPTDTSYGLAVDATNLNAIDKLFQLKGRQKQKPIHVIFPSFVELNRAVKLNSIAKRLMQKFFPGPLTLVLPLKSKSENWEILSAGTGYLGFRNPDDQIVKALVRECKLPITTTSANLSGKANTYSVKQVKRQFKKSKIKPNLYLNGGTLKKIKPSTVIRISGPTLEILREGPITIKQIQSAI